jgi:oxygen-independent coproporphyrinogen-3 oxidase
MDKIISAAPDRLSVFNYAHLPDLFAPQRRINEADLPSAAEKLQILRMTGERLLAAGYVYIGMDHFAKPDDELAAAQRDGTLYRNFQGYSTHADCDLIACGITAIGKVGDTYSQNVKTLEEYYAAVDAGILPIWRGVRLNADDLLRREVISQLICHFALDMRRIEYRFDIDFHRYFAAELADLKTLQDDGLIAVGGDTIRVLPAGRLLIRNVCMVFDRYLRAGREQRFSKVI